MEIKASEFLSLLLLLTCVITEKAVNQLYFFSSLK